MSELNEEIWQLAEDARHLGYDKRRVIRRLGWCIVRDRVYLDCQRSRGMYTPHDEMLTEDVAVTALVLIWLEYGEGSV